MAIQTTIVYRGRTATFTVDTRALAPLDIAAESTFDRWVAAPEWDTRTLAEFAASGGSRMAPPATLPSPPWP